MAEFYHSTTCEVTTETEVAVHWNETGKQFHVWIGNGLSRVTIMLDTYQLDRLAEVILVAQKEHDIRTGRVVLYDGDGLVPGGRPVKSAAEKCDGCGREIGRSAIWAEYGHRKLCMDCDNDDKVTIGKDLKYGK
jgi:hypothetical protein